MDYSGDNRRAEPSNSDIMHTLGRLEEGVCTMHKKQDTTNGRILSSEKRINNVERRQSWFMGGLAAIPVIGGISAWVVSHLK